MQGTLTTRKPNAAQQLRAALGIEVPSDEAARTRSASTTKRGPGRRHVSGHERGVKRVKEAGGFGKGLVASWTAKQKRALELKRSAA